MKGLKKRWARWSKRLRRLVVLTLFACLAVSVLMVAPLRWIDPPVSAVMLQRYLAEVFGNYDKVKQGRQYTVAMAQREPD